MKAYQLTDGGTVISEREYDIAPSTAIKCGALVKLADGLITPVSDGETGPILGIASEHHSGASDALNARSDGNKILVIDAPNLIFTSPAFEIEASGGSATTVTATTLGAYSADDFKGGYLMLVKKAEGSTNTGAIGEVRRIESSSYEAVGTVSTFTVANGAAAFAGDTYKLFAPIGLAKFGLSADKDALTCAAVDTTSVKVVGYDLEASELKCMAASHFLAN